MNVARAVWWALVTGRDRDLDPAPPWWRGPVWIRWTVVLGFVAWWGMSGFVVWAWPANSNGVLAVVLIALQISSPLLSHRYPLTAVRIAFVATIIALLAVAPLPHRIALVHSWPLDTYLLLFAPVVISAIARSRPGYGVGIALSAMLLLGAGAVPVGLRFGIGVMTGPLVFLVFIVAIGYLVGDARRAKLETGAERRLRTNLQERNRIARELHDVIGHHLSMIAVRTDSAPYRLTVDDAAKEEFVALGTAAREALAEARQLLGVLREDGDTESEHMPAPTIGDIPELVQRSRESGVDVRLTVDGEVTAVPALVGLSAYRIVQESLSNARRHSPGTAVEVRIRACTEEIELSVDNGPHGPGGLPGTGAGLAGIQERVGLVGGTCTAGRRPDGGFRVWARLPR